LSVNPSDETKPKEPVAVARRAAAVMKLLRETFTHVTGDPVQGERISWQVCRQWAGVRIHVPTLADIERLASEEAIVRTFLRDPSRASVQSAAERHDRPVRELSRVMKQRQGGRGLAYERARRGMTCRRPRFGRGRVITI
jgi:hypothetical protein